MLRRTFAVRKGDLAAVVLHDCNPQHGAPYNNHDRAMRDEEFQAFLASVKGWKVLESGAIHRSFQFPNYRLAYEWMGRVFAFGYVADKYPKLHWKENFIEVTIYSGRFHGITKREARLAAFMNDHFNLLKKALVAQQEAIKDSQRVNPLKTPEVTGSVAISKGTARELRERMEQQQRDERSDDAVESPEPKADELRQ